MKKEYFEILMEEMNGKFDLVLEGHSVLRHEIQGFSRKTDERFELVDLKFEALNDKIDSVDQRLSDKIDSVNKNLNDKIDSVDQRLSDKIDSVDRSLNDKIDSVNQSLGDKIDSVAAELKAHRADTEAHHGIYRVGERP